MPGALAQVWTQRWERGLQEETADVWDSLASQPSQLVDSTLIERTLSQQIKAERDRGKCLPLTCGRYLHACAPMPTCTYTCTDGHIHICLCVSVCLSLCLSVCKSVCLSLSFSHTHTRECTHVPEINKYSDRQQ